MKIALLAPSGAGKTTFLTGLYGVLTRDVNNDHKYGINFAVTDIKRKGFLEDRYAALIEEDQSGEPSSRLDKYPVTLSSNFQKLNIELVDFPGGHLHRVGESEDAKKEVETTIAELSTCDGFIVLLDGEAVIKGSEKGNSRITQNRLKADAVKQILYAALERRRINSAISFLRNIDDYAFNRGKTPIVFALTKGDEVDKWLKSEENVHKFDNSIRSLFQDATLYNSNEGAIGNLIRSQYHQILLMPDVVSLRAAVTVYDQANKTFAPRNLEKLLQFVVFAGLNNAVSEYDRRANSYLYRRKDREKARSNKYIAQIFRERILPPTFAHALSKGPGKQEFFYQDGLPLEALAKEQWWQEKCMQGERILPSAHNLKPEPASSFTHTDSDNSTQAFSKHEHNI